MQELLNRRRVSRPVRSLNRKLAKQPAKKQVKKPVKSPPNGGRHIA
jgi:hypothetical protein